MKIGILGTGLIAQTVAPTIAEVNETECYAVASRTYEKAEEFAKRFGFEKAYGSYEELYEDPDVDMIYVATPHSLHFENMMDAIKHKKAVLCEKAFTVNAAQAREIAKAAKKNNVFAAEAIWPRYMPSRKIIRDTIESGIIGKPSILTANLSYIIYMNKRIMDPALAGGALLDVGVYGLNFALMHFGNDIERIETSVRMTDTGVDGLESITLFYNDGRMAVLTHGIYARSDRKGIIYGDKGYIVVENINNPRDLSVFDTEDNLIKHIDFPKQFSGYEYEFRECAEAAASGRIECDSMPLADSIRVMEVMDAVRNKWGLKYPIE